MNYKHSIFLVLITLLTSGVCAQQTAKLFVELPDYCPTPDALDIAPDGSLTLSCPNYVSKTQPPLLVKINKKGEVSKYNLIPGLTDSTYARPVGIAYASDGSLFVCDNQNKQRARILRCVFDGERLKSYEVIAYGLSNPNGIRYYDGAIYFTQPKLTKFKTEKLTSGVYRFNVQTVIFELIMTVQTQT